LAWRREVVRVADGVEGVELWRDGVVAGGRRVGARRKKLSCV
jgi:hypothetical protein